MGHERKKERSKALKVFNDNDIMDDRKARKVANHDAEIEQEVQRKRQHNREMKKEAHRRYQSSYVEEKYEQKEEINTQVEKYLAPVILDLGEEEEEEEEFNGMESMALKGFADLDTIDLFE
jgi:hypothetical protein